MKWVESDDSTLINDERFAPAGVLAPKSKADFAFVLHALGYLFHQPPRYRGSSRYRTRCSSRSAISRSRRARSRSRSA
ncbi:N-6 DNA methylase [Luteimonas sp. A277]